MTNDYFSPFSGPTPPPGEPALLPEERARLRQNIRRAGNRNGLLLLGVLVLSNGLSLGLRAALSALPGFRGLSADWQSSLFTLAAYLAMYAVTIPLLLMINRAGNPGRARISFRKPAIRGGELAKWCLIAFGVTYAVNYVCNLFFQMIQMMGIPLHAPSLVLQPTLFDNLMTLVFFAIAAPLCEELLFRGALLGNARPACGDWCGVVFVAVLFGLTHVNYQQIFYAAALGLFAGWLSVRARSIWPAILVHFCLNLVGALQSILLSRAGTMSIGNLLACLRQGDSRALLSMAIFGISLLCLAAAAAGCVLLWVELSRRRAAFRAENIRPVRGRVKALWFFTAPGAFLFVLAALALTVYNALGH